MKKLLLLCATAAFFSTANAQELVKGGNMENESDWTVFDTSPLNIDIAEVTFNYKGDKPINGVDGCLSIAFYGQCRNFIYQRVELTKGHKYELSAAFKNASADKITAGWAELWVSHTEPNIPEGKNDWGASKGDYLFQFHSWKKLGDYSYSDITGADDLIKNIFPFEWVGAGASGDSLLSSPLDPVRKNTVIFTLPDTSSTTTWYVGIKCGAWGALGATTPAFEFLYDEISLKDVTSTNIKESIASEIIVFPNPAADFVTVKNTAANSNYEIFDLSGKILKSGVLNSNNIDVRALNSGLYYISVKNNSEKTVYKLVIK